MKFRAFLLGLVLAATVPHHAGAQDPCAIGWNAPLRISADSAIATLPLLRRGNGALHLLWFGLDDTPDLSLASAGIRYSRSTDGGSTFEPPVVLLPFLNTLTPGGFIAADGDRVYVTASALADTFVGIVLFRSSDRGATWEGPSPVYREPAGPRFFPSSIAASGPAVFIGFRDFESNQYGMVRSGDGGATWTAPSYLGLGFSDIETRDGRFHAAGPVPGAGQTEVGYSVSPDSGRTWFPSGIVSPEDQVRSVSGTLSTSPGGNIYVSWIDTGVVLSRTSRNGGVSWGGFTVLSDEPGNAVDDIGSDDEFVFVVWDRDVSNGRGLRARFSNDYGSVYCPVITPAGSVMASEPSVQVVDSTVHLVWVDTAGGSAGIFYRRGALPGNPDIDDRAPGEFALGRCYPNPSNGTAYIDFDLPVGTEVVIELWSAIGQRVAVLENGFFDPGRYTLTVDTAVLPSGAYFYRLSAPRFVSTGKMMVLR